MVTQGVENKKIKLVRALGNNESRLTSKQKLGNNREEPFRQIEKVNRINGKEVKNFDKDN